MDSFVNNLELYSNTEEPLNVLTFKNVNKHCAIVIIFIKRTPSIKRTLKKVPRVSSNNRGLTIIVHLVLLIICV